jgi:hypothetical protein
MAVNDGASRIYFNMSVYNDTATTPQPAKIEQIYPFPLLRSVKTGDYDSAVVRAQFPCGGIDPVDLPHIVSFFFVTNHIPIVGEWDATGNFPFFSDLMVQGTGGGPLSPADNVIYEPFFYRKYGLSGQGALNIMDVQIWYKLPNGTTKPLMLPPIGHAGLYGGSASVKLLLIRKDIAGS